MFHLVSHETSTRAVDMVLPAIPDLLILPAAHAVPADRDPEKGYLSRLDISSRRTMLTALNAAATRLTGGRLTAEHVPWVIST
jgi:hypothetical protein